MSAAVSLSQRILDVDQGSADWFTARLGCVTSSRIADAVAKRKKVKPGEMGKEMACRQNLRIELMFEMLSGKASEHYVSKWMEDGKEKEPLARVEYELLRDCTVEQIGFVYHPTIKRGGRESRRICRRRWPN